VLTCRYQQVRPRVRVHRAPARLAALVVQLLGRSENATSEVLSLLMFGPPFQQMMALAAQFQPGSSWPLAM